MAKSKKEEQPTSAENSLMVEESGLKAKKDWHILSGGWNKEKNKHEIDILIKKGDDVAKLKLHPKYIAVLRAEHVI